MHVSYRWSDIYATAPTLFSTAPTEDSDAEYEEHEGAKGTWMVECSCGNIWDGNAQCPDCGDYKFVFVERPWPTFARRVRSMRLLRGVARCAVRLQSACMPNPVASTRLMILLSRSSSDSLPGPVFHMEAIRRILV